MHTGCYRIITADRPPLTLTCVCACIRPHGITGCASDVPSCAAQAWGNAVRKIYAVLPRELDTHNLDCQWNHAQNITEELWQRTKAQLIDHGRHVLCSFHLNATRLAAMVAEELYLQREFYHDVSSSTARSEKGRRGRVKDVVQTS